MRLDVVDVDDVPQDRPWSDTLANDGRHQGNHFRAGQGGRSTGSATGWHKSPPVTQGVRCHRERGSGSPGLPWLDISDVGWS